MQPSPEAVAEEVLRILIKAQIRKRKESLPILPAEDIIAISGGKDSTALALRMKEKEPKRKFTFLITPTGDELPEMFAHWERLEGLLGQPLTRVGLGKKLSEVIEEEKLTPNHRMRWCTRRFKIETCLAYLRQRPGSRLFVGLRADEEARKGLYSKEVQTEFPFREWGWGLPEVVGYLKHRGVIIPKRTDCWFCFDQRIGEWANLYWDHQGLWQRGKQLEVLTGHTFRNGRSMEEMEKRFEKKGRQLGLDFEDEEEEDYSKCRVCSL